MPGFGFHWFSDQRLGRLVRFLFVADWGHQSSPYSNSP
jgi:hypothetical protein